MPPIGFNMIKFKISRHDLHDANFAEGRVRLTINWPHRVSRKRASAQVDHLAELAALIQVQHQTLILQMGNAQIPTAHFDRRPQPDFPQTINDAGVETYRSQTQIVATHFTLLHSLPIVLQGAGKKYSTR